MRKLWLIGCSVLLLSSLLLAKDKLVSQWNCGQPSDAHSIDVGDQANHSYAVTKTTCTATKSEVLTMVGCERRRSMWLPRGARILAWLMPGRQIWDAHAGVLEPKRGAVPKKSGTTPRCEPANDAKALLRRLAYIDTLSRT